MKVQKNEKRRIAVFCASSDGVSPAYRAEATRLGQLIAASGLGLVYGGGSFGLMGAVANGALSAGGEVIGILPQLLVEKEVAHKGLTELHIVKTMHERKAMLSALSSAFLALPGGYGTVDEFIETTTWNQLHIHQKPCVLINTLGYWNPMIAWVEQAVKAGFVRAANQSLIQVAEDSAAALRLIQD
jgi:hypothetical protein